MPIGKVVTASIYSQLLAQSFRGKDTGNLADIVGTTIARFLSLPNRVTFFMSGVAGPTSTINSVAVVGLAPPVMAQSMVGMARLNKMIGRDISRLLSAISLRACLAVQASFINGSAIGIGAGSGIGTFTGVNYKLLSKMLYSQALFKKFTGRDCARLADSIAFGFAQHLMTQAKVTAVALGAPAPVPPVGPVPVIGIPSVFSKIV